MFTKQRAGRGLVAVLLAMPLVCAASGGAAASTGAAAPTALPMTDTAPDVRTPSGSVTLITGDRLSLTANGQVSVMDTPSRHGISFITYGQHGNVYAIPSDAQPMVFGGQMDMELFDLTRLLAYGSSTQSQATSVIVQYQAGKESAARSDLTGSAAGGATVTRQLPVVHGVAMRSPHSGANQFWRTLTVASGRSRTLRPGIRKVSLDRVYKLDDATSDPQIGAPTAWAAGYDGTGETVAVVDSGIDSTHPDLAGKVLAADNFTTESNTNDNLGHGTHVASIIAGTGAASGGVQKGVAPAAHLISAKACTGDGRCDDSAIIAAMQWAVQTEGAKIVSMSLGGSATAGADDPLDQAVNTLTANYGALFVVAAGNAGPNYHTVSSPGDADSALTVGAVDSIDNIAAFSGRGPRLGDGVIKPDITAPGVDITGACSSTGTFCNPGQQYVKLSGTSMATPHVSGAAAILLQAHPTWTPAQLKAALMASANPNPNLNTFTQGAGRVDIARGYTQSVVASPPSVSLGVQDQPRANDPVLTPSVAYHNYGSSSVTLQLALNLTGPDGNAPPAGMFSLSATSVTVPAGGQASVTLTANTTVSGPYGFYTGYITATSGSTRVETPVGDDQEPPSVDLTLTNISRSGGTPTTYLDLVMSEDGNQIYVLYNPPQAPPKQSDTVRLPAGNYTVFTSVGDFDAQGNPEVSVLTMPTTAITTSQTIVSDARTAGKLNVTVPDSNAVPFYTELTSLYAPSAGGYPTGTSGYPWFGQVSYGANLFMGQLGPPNTWVYGFTSKVSATFYDPGPTGTESNSPHVYHLAWFLDQHLPTGLTENVPASSLATAQASYAAQESNTTGQVAAVPEPSQHMYPVGVDLGAIFAPTQSGLPFQNSVSYNTDSNIRWYSTFDEVDSNFNHVVDLMSGLTAYTGGNTSYRQTWNKPVFGAAFTSIVSPLNWVVRTGNTIYADPPLAGDSGGNAGHDGNATISQGQITLKENGTTLGTTEFGGSQQYLVPAFTVPAAQESYELDASVQRTSAVALATNVNAVWQFTSSGVDPNSVLPMQMWGVTFAPNLNDSNTASANTAFQIPMTVAAQPSSAAAGIQAVTLDYSTDDGTTWKPATVTGNPQTGSYTATVQHPNITGFVSLRVHVADYAANTFTETITRAYKIAPAS